MSRKFCPFFSIAAGGQIEECKKETCGIYNHEYNSCGLRILMGISRVAK